MANRPESYRFCRNVFNCSEVCVYGKIRSKDKRSYLPVEFRPISDQSSEDSSTQTSRSWVRPDEFCYGDPGATVWFNFANTSGQVVKYLVTGRMFYPVVQIKTKSTTYLYYLYVESNQLVLRPSSSTSSSTTANLTNRIFLYLPAIGHRLRESCSSNQGAYTTNCNLSGYFYVYGNSIDDSTVWLMGSHLTDQLYLKKRYSCRDNILARDCLSDCTNRTSGQDDGCGSPCADESAPLTRKCFDDSPCSGSCYGQCPEGQRCVRDGNGQHYCKPISSNQGCGWNWGWYLLLIILFGIVIAGLAYLWQDPPPRKVPNSSSCSKDPSKDNSCSDPCSNPCPNPCSKPNPCVNPCPPNPCPPNPCPPKPCINPCPSNPCSPKPCMNPCSPKPCMNPCPPKPCVNPCPPFITQVTMPSPVMEPSTIVPVGMTPLVISPVQHHPLTITSPSLSPNPVNPSPYSPYPPYSSHSPYPQVIYPQSSISPGIITSSVPPGRIGPNMISPGISPTLTQSVRTPTSSSTSSTSSTVYPVYSPPTSLKMPSVYPISSTTSTSATYATAATTAIPTQVSMLSQV